MGYLTTVDGTIAIHPPISWAELRDTPFIDPYQGCVFIKVEETTVETLEGLLTRREGVAVVPWGEDSFKAYTIVEDLQKIVDAFGEGRTFTGRLDGEGEENSDMWRLYVRDGKAVQVKARVVWPDGEET